jgi:hypothetical protein
MKTHSFKTYLFSILWMMLLILYAYFAYQNFTRYKAEWFSGKDFVREELFGHIVHYGTTSILLTIGLSSLLLASSGAAYFKKWIVAVGVLAFVPFLALLMLIWKAGFGAPNQMYCHKELSNEKEAAVFAEKVILKNFGENAAAKFHEQLLQMDARNWDTGQPDVSDALEVMQGPLYVTQTLGRWLVTTEPPAHSFFVGIIAIGMSKGPGCLVSVSYDACYPETTPGCNVHAVK